MFSFKKLVLTSLILFILSACTGIPKNLSTVKGFDSDKYLGTWYEIARLDHKFERGMSHVQATYAKRDKGGLTVLNKGYVQADKVWKSVEGKAFLNGEPDEGRLKVSFFGPFYGGYNILVLDKQYQYSMVAGPDRDMLWILSRTKVMDDRVYQYLIEQANTWGFDTKSLIKVDQGDIPST